jgi:hypothetical protein
MQEIREVREGPRASAWEGMDALGGVFRDAAAESETVAASDQEEIFGDTLPDLDLPNR